VNLDEQKQKLSELQKKEAVEGVSGSALKDENGQTEKERNREQKMKEEGLQLELAPLVLVDTPETIKRAKEIEANNQKVKDRIREIDAEFDSKNGDGKEKRKVELTASNLNNGLSNFKLEEAETTGGNDPSSPLKMFNIKKDGNIIGYISLKMGQDGNWGINYIDIKKSERRKGYAESLYKDLNESLKKNNQGELHSDKTLLESEQDASVSPPKKLWEKLIKEGVAEKTNDGRYKFKKTAVEQAPTQYTEAATPKKEVVPTTKESEMAASEKVGFTEAKDLNKIYADLKTKYGDKKGSALYEVANRLVNPNENTIVEIRSNGVVVKEGDKYILKPFGNTDANMKKWTLYKGLDVTEQFAKPTKESSVDVSDNPALKDVESTAKALDGVELPSKFVAQDKGGILNRENYYRLAQEKFQESEGLTTEEIFDKNKQKEEFKTQKGRDAFQKKFEQFAENPINKKQIISEAYHKAKADGSNPELVKA
ncbi:MAG TPA: GNAT family N-acetyltransferase, partial [bacterium]|nr:GNAT family N-acetyltransferase [bacterium]